MPEFEMPELVELEKVLEKALEKVLEKVLANMLKYT